MIKVLFIRPSKSSFIQNDLKLLRKHFDVRVVDFILNRKDPKNTFKTVWDLITGVVWADLTFSWFADVHAYWAVRLSKIFRKKSIVVVGGYEVANVPGIGYGAVINPKTFNIVNYAIDNADIVLTVDESLKKDAIKNYGIKEENILTLPTGYDHEFFKPEGKKENLVITVSYIDNVVIKRKGLDNFVKTAFSLPDVNFIIIGPDLDGSADSLKDIAPPNIKFINYLPQNELLNWYQKSKVYCQLSRYEGLPNALCEAMLCECVPVGTEYCGIPNAIGDTGFYVPYNDPEATADAIKKALLSDMGKEARARIIEKFPVSKREEILEDIIENL